MEPVNSEVINAFLQRLSERYSEPATFYLLGGSALCLMGSPRRTLDVDFTFELSANIVSPQLSAINNSTDELNTTLEHIKKILEQMGNGEHLGISRQTEVSETSNLADGFIEYICKVVKPGLKLE